MIRGRSPGGLLDTYGEERSPHVRQTTLAAIGLGRVICERDPVKACARDAALRERQGGEVKTEIRQQMIPGLLGGLIARETRAAGTVFPQAWVRAEGRFQRMDDLVGCGVLVFVDGALPAAWQRDYHDLAAASGGTIVELASAGRAGMPRAIVERDAVLENWFKTHRARVAVVRPDRYVHGTAGTWADGVVLLRGFERGLAVC